MTNIVICTTPIRPYPTDFPPFGSMAIIQAIRKNINATVDFYNIDFHRPDLHDVEFFFKNKQCDILGISAVVSTAYAYVKELTNLVKAVSPQTIIIVGGNLAASAEILLKKCPVDYCVVGDGEQIIVELINTITNIDFKITDLHLVKGIAFLQNGNFVFTGHGKKPSAGQIEIPDYSILAEDDSLDFFISRRVQERLFAYEGFIDPAKKVATVVMTKGCVARCTFCHRWEKGFRVLPIEKLSSHLDWLVNEHNVGFIQIADENFGSDKQAAIQIANKLGELGVLWQVAGVRTSTVTKDALMHWKKNGCLSVYYGIESGSPKILEIMEKKTTVSQNINALKWTGEAGLNTIIQLIIGMPGEDDETINETFEFLKTVAPYILQWKDRAASDLISINYAQALPGTPLYEYGRQNGLIGSKIDDEENYLLSISDTDAYKDDHFVNMTSQPLLKVLCWRKILLAKLDDFHYRSMSEKNNYMSLWSIYLYYAGLISDRVKSKIFGIKKVNYAGELKRDFVTESGYFNIHAGLKFSPLLLNPKTEKMLFPAVAIYIICANLYKRPTFSVKLIWEYLIFNVRFSTKAKPSPDSSLRKLVEYEDGSMGELRRGR